jgi:hypothetical protein
MKHDYRLRRAVRLRCIPGTLLSLTLAANVATAADYTNNNNASRTWRAEMSGPDDTKFRLEVYDRIRGEFANWFGDPIVNGTVVPKESSYDFMANKFQLGLRVTGKPFEAFAQFQDTVITGLPENGVGIGSVYFANVPHSTQNGAFLRQGWAKLKYDNFYLTGGRQLYTDWAPGAAKNKSLKWIQDYRLAQRLIGPWDYTHTGRSFDGGTIGYLSDDFEVSTFGFMPTFGGFDTNAMNTITDIKVAGATLGLRDSEAIGNTLGRLSYYYFEDDRGLLVPDNRPEAARAAAKGQALEIHTVGAAAAHVMPVGPGLLDGVFYAFGQFGNWQNLDQRAWAYGVEVGYQFPDVWANPWLRAGINSGSGDSNPNDGVHETFFQMLPTVFLYAQFPFYNMMNNQDVFVQALAKPHPMVNLRADFHWLKVDQSRDLLYAGSGATNDKVFGFVGTPTGGFDDLAYLTHFTVNVKPLEYLSFNFVYGHAFGQDIINAQYTGKEGDYGFMEAIVSF